jgi:hypothetical protein
MLLSNFRNKLKINWFQFLVPLGNLSSGTEEAYAEKETDAWWAHHDP